MVTALIVIPVVSGPPAWTARDWCWAPTAAGLAVFTVLGSAAALRRRGGLPVAALFGVVTGTGGGGAARHPGQPGPRALTGQIYAVASLIGASIYVVLVDQEAGVWVGGSVRRGRLRPAGVRPLAGLVAADGGRRPRRIRWELTPTRRRAPRAIGHACRIFSPASPLPTAQRNEGIDARSGDRPRRRWRGGGGARSGSAVLTVRQAGRSGSWRSPRSPTGPARPDRRRDQSAEQAQPDRSARLDLFGGEIDRIASSRRPSRTWLKPVGVLLFTIGFSVNVQATWTEVGSRPSRAWPWPSSCGRPSAPRTALLLPMLSSVTISIIVLTIYDRLKAGRSC